MSEKVTIFDTTLRDGEQSAGVQFDADTKLAIARQLADLRVDVVEAGFPAASVTELEAVRRIATEVRDVQVCGLARAVPGDVEAAIEALRPAAAPRIHVFVNASDMQLAKQLHRSRVEVVEIASSAIQRARAAVPEVEFSPMDATRADPTFLAQLVDAAIDAGATTINIPDTVGYILPHQLDRLIRELYGRVPRLQDVVLSFHGQDDLGMATANAVAAIGAGARQVELTVNGIGERAGNTPLEEVVMAIAVHGEALGVHTDVRTQGIQPLSRVVERASGLQVPANKAIVGRNAFRHASGIHQDGVVKCRQTYEVIDPAVVGNEEGTTIVLGKLSGRAGFAARARALGYHMSAGMLAKVFASFQALADTKAEVSDADVAELCDRAGIPLSRDVA